MERLHRNDPPLIVGIIGDPEKMPGNQSSPPIELNIAKRREEGRRHQAHHEQKEKDAPPPPPGGGDPEGEEKSERGRKKSTQRCRVEAVKKGAFLPKKECGQGRKSGPSLQIECSPENQQKRIGDKEGTGQKEEEEQRIRTGMRKKGGRCRPFSSLSLWIF